MHQEASVSDENSYSSQQNVSDGSAETQDETARSSGSGSEEISSLKDGVYSGTGTGFRGETTVSVTVANGQITDITINANLKVSQSHPQTLTRK